MKGRLGRQRGVKWQRRSIKGQVVTQYTGIQVIFSSSAKVSHFSNHQRLGYRLILLSFTGDVATAATDLPLGPGLDADRYSRKTKS